MIKKMKDIVDCSKCKSVAVENLETGECECVKCNHKWREKSADQTGEQTPISSELERDQTEDSQEG